MQCPECSAELIQQQYGAVVVDRCLDCGGFWFDPDEGLKKAIVLYRVFYGGGEALMSREDDGRWKVDSRLDTRDE